MITVRNRQAKAGFTILELVVTAGILGVVAVGVMSAYDYAFKSSQTMSAQRQTGDVSIGTMQQTTDAFSQFIVNFNDTGAQVETGGIFPLNATLPVGFSPNAFANATECGGCPGRIGFVIQPMRGYRGLYRTTIRIQNSDGGLQSAPREMMVVTADSE